MTNSQILTGRVYDGISSIARTGIVERQGDQILLKFDEELLVYDLLNIRISARLAKLPRSIQFSDGRKFETSDNDAVDLLFPRSKGRIDSIEKPWTLAIAALVSIVCLIVFSFTHIIPKFSRFIAPHLPEAVPKLISDHLRYTIDKLEIMKPTALTDKEKASALDAFKLIHKKYPKSVLLFRKADYANAFALPDGTIYVTDKLIHLLKDPPELYAVFLHETGHVVHHHGLAGLISSSGLALLISTAIGNPDLFGISFFLLNNKYSHNFETEADDFASHALKADGMSSESLASALQKIAQYHGDQGDIPALLSTHPLTQERVIRIKNFEKIKSVKARTSEIK